MPDQDLNNLREGTYFVRDHQNGRDSYGVRTYVLRAGVNNVSDLANKSRNVLGLYWPGTTVPLKRTLAIKKDGGRGFFVETYGYPKGKSQPGEEVRRVEILAGQDQVDWYPVNNSVNVDETYLPLKVDSPGNLQSGEKQEKEKHAQTNPGKYGRNFVYWRIMVPFDIGTIPLHPNVQRMSGKCNKNAYTLRGLKKFKPFELLFLPPNAIPSEGRGGVRYRGWYEFRYLKGGWRRMVYADGKYYKLLLYEKAKFTDPPY